ncbi:hypothetical protein BC827DRAFT_1387161 [Russula dissimulans]|nr:hypothetical protein BC827DRAFT_1387161 [Russula dissimulans]
MNPTLPSQSRIGLQYVPHPNLMVNMFSLTFQCIVNVGIHGSELIRSRVVQAGTLGVVGSILESCLASKMFAVGLSSSVAGMPRETRERQAVRKVSDSSPHLSQEDDQMDDSNATQADISGVDYPTPTSDAVSAAAGSDADTSTPTDTSKNHTPAGLNACTWAVEVPGREHNLCSTSHGASHPEMETEDGADGDLDMDPVQEATDDSPEQPQSSPLTRRAIAIVSDIRADAGQSLEPNSDAHILINSDAGVQGDPPNIIFPVSRVSSLSSILATPALSPSHLPSASLALILLAPLLPARNHRHPPAALCNIGL